MFLPSQPQTEILLSLPPVEYGLEACTTATDSIEFYATLNFERKTVGLEMLTESFEKLSAVVYH